MGGLVAGLMRFGGSKSGGEVALSRALSLLIDAPPGVRPMDAALTIEEIVALVRRPEEGVAGWAARGMLGDPQVRELKGLGRSVQAVAVRTADVREAVAPG